MPRLIRDLTQYNANPALVRTGFTYLARASVSRILFI